MSAKTLSFLCCVLLLQGYGNAVDEALESGDVERVLRVIGGEKVTNPTQWPWLVSIEASITTSSLGPIPLVKMFNSCGASVINSRWLLTAAHCFDAKDGRNPKHWVARLATLRRKPGVIDYLKHAIGKIFKKEDWVMWNMDIEKIIVHAQYNPDYITNDIALMKLKKEVPAGDEFERIHKVPLPIQGDRRHPYAGQKCIIHGWGCKKFGGKGAEDAYQAELPVLSDRECINAFSIRPDRQICAGGVWLGRGVCPGDSGGPLVCEVDNKWMQVGVISFMHSYKAENYPQVMTRVSHYRAWIDVVIQNH